MTSTKVKMFHILAMGFFLGVSYRIQFYQKVSQDPTVRNMQRFSLRFLTNWTFTMEATYFALCLMTYFFSMFRGAQELKNQFEKSANDLAVIIATPMSLVVTVVFWAIYIVDRELVFPKALDDVMPPWLNHSIHTFNAVFILADLYLVNHKYPSWRKAFRGILYYLLAYSVCVFGTYIHDGIWLYPFLNKLTYPQIGVFSILVLVISYLSYAFTKILHKLRWGDALPTTMDKVKKTPKQKRK